MHLPDCIMQDLSDEYEFRSEFNDKYSITSRRILRKVSEDARASISEMAAYAGASRKTTVQKLKDLERVFGIKYTAELNAEALHIDNAHLIVLKFRRRPDYSKILRQLSGSYIPQIAVTTKGDYDMLIFAAAPSAREYANWDKSMQIKLYEYGASWNSSWIVHRQLGFIPVRNELIARLAIEQKYKDMLMILNSNSRTSFQSMSKQLGMHFNTVAYNFNKLVRMGYIRRFTISMSPTKSLSFTSFLAKYTPAEGYESASANARKAFMSDDKDSLISRYILCAPLIGSYDFFTLGVFDSPDAAYRHDVQYHKRLFKEHGVRLEYAGIDTVLLGRLPIRSVDTRKEYNTIRWTTEMVDSPSEAGSYQNNKQP